MDSRDNEAVVLFTGGADSGLAAVLSLNKHDKVMLLTFRNGWELFLKRSCVMADRLKEKYGRERIRHSFINNQRLFRLTLGSIRTNYLKNIGHLCLVERVSLYVATVIFCLENRIRSIIDGSNKRQGDVAPPQMPEVLSLISSFLQSYGLEYTRPLYGYEGFPEDQLVEIGLMRKDELYQRQALFFKDDSWLLWDMVGGLIHKFKNPLHPVFLIESFLQFLGRITKIKSRTVQVKCQYLSRSVRYVEEALEFADDYIKSYFNKRNMDLASLIGPMENK